MREINLTQGETAKVDDEDFEWLNSFKWCTHKNINNFYAIRSVRVNGKKVSQKMNQLIMGDNPLKLMIDHRDGNGLNNQKSNLRFCTNQENQMNQRPQKNCSSVYKGVYWQKQKKRWRARIKINRKFTHIGYFKIEEDAARAYNAAAIKSFGEFAYLNLFNKTNA